jgi:N-acyl-D-amino-acid deacylase
MLDRLITGARVFDGRRLHGDWNVGIDGDRIGFIGNDAPPAQETTDARGLILSPSFIDSHNHGDFHCIDPGNDGISSVSQGVGMLVIGNCGMSATPATQPSPVLLPQADAVCVGLEQHRRRLAGDLPLDVSDLIGHGTLRTAVLGGARQATSGDIGRMAAVLDEFLGCGGLGMSVGLDYPESAGYSDSELFALCAVLARYDRPLTCHLRGIGADLMGAIDEVATLGERTGCPVLISHLRPVPVKFDHLLPQILQRIDARDKLFMDVYPYDAGCTSLAWLFHRTFGRSPTTADDFFPVEEVEASIDDICADGSWDLRILEHGDLSVMGKTVAELAIAAGERPGLMMQRLLLADPQCLCIYHHVANPASVDRILLHPKCFLGSDGYLFSSSYQGLCHPRSFAAFTRFLIRYVRSGRLSLEDGLAKLTRAPAAFFHLPDVGEIRLGARANLCLFALEELVEHADFAAPSRVSSGMREVMVGGRSVWRTDRTAGIRPGRRASPIGQAQA